MQINYTKKFKKRFAKLPVKVINKFAIQLHIFINNQRDKALNDHKLTGKYKGCKSINITGDYRAIYKVTSRGSCLFMEIGTHHQLYGK